MNPRFERATESYVVICKVSFVLVGLAKGVANMVVDWKRCAWTGHVDHIYWLSQSGFTVVGKPFCSNGEPFINHSRQRLRLTVVIFNVEKSD
jgi:hypothetical protein